MIRRRDDLKRVRAGCDGLIFDGMTFDDWTTEDAICLLDMDKPRSLPTRFSDAFIEADVPMIFFTNKEPGKIFPERYSWGGRTFTQTEASAEGAIEPYNELVGEDIKPVATITVTKM